MPQPHKILTFVEPIEAEVVDDPAQLETEIVNDISPEPKGSPLSLPRLGWALARQGLLWRQDTASWMLLALREGKIVTEHPTELDVRRAATLFLAERFAAEPALGALMKADAIYGVPKILQQAKLFSMAGRPGGNAAEEFVRRYVTDRIENGLGNGRAVPRYESVTSAALKALYEKIKRNDPLKRSLIRSRIQGGHRRRLPQQPSGRLHPFCEGHRGARLEGTAYQDGLGRF